MFAWISSRASIYTIVVWAILFQLTTDANPTSTPYKVCAKRTITIGTRVAKNVDDDVPKCQGCNELRNCTSVFGSVHFKGVIFGRNEHLRKEFRFPKLREITGHLIVTFLRDVTSMSDILPNLAVIHGRVEYLFEGYALVVYQNKGLQNLGLNSLSVIKQGGIKIEFNQKLCYLDRIRWQSLMGYGDGKKYELDLNGNSKDCFAKCSEYCRTPSGHGSSGHTYCWGRERKNCQKLCHSKCGTSGCEEGSQDKCCDKECLGGCTRAKSPHHCYACERLRLESGTCVTACPSGLKELENFICVPRCPGKIAYELSGKCFKDCPAGYTKAGGFFTPKYCKKCKNGSCPRVCKAPRDSSNPFIRTKKIKLLSDSATLKGCTILEGNLEIEIRSVPGGTNLAQVLSEDLGHLEEVRGYVVVRQSTPLISLNFFKTLKKISLRLSGFSTKRYALAIFDNPNLESLWDFHRNFRIDNRLKSLDSGGIFVQLNPRLCLYNIYPLIDDVLKWNRTDPIVDISKTTNGNARTCNVHLINITITPAECGAGRKEICVEVSWPNKFSNGADYRDILLYSVWYRETQSRDLNEYDDIDACSSDHVWNRQDYHSTQETGNTISKIVDRLKAYTLYAFRVEAIVIAGKGVKSAINYYQTKQTKPSVPRNLEVSFLSSSSLQVKWKTPFYPNGEITHYVIRYHESQSSHLWDIKFDWCKNQISSFNFYKKREEKVDEEKSGENSCIANITCDCDNKDKKLAPDLKEALFSKEFQDKILSTVFTKKDDKNDDKATSRPVTTTRIPLNVVTKKRNDTSQGCGNNSKNSSCPSVRPNTTLSTPNLTTVMSTLPPPTQAPVITRSTTAQSYILTELKYFTEYSVEVCACNAGAGCGVNEKLIMQCSTAVGRTEKNDTADNVGQTLKVAASNSSKEFTLEWKAPVSPNGVVLRYDIWIENKDFKSNKTTIETPCVLSSQTTYARQGVSLGDYSVKVRAITPVGNGSWSNEVSFKIIEQLQSPTLKSVQEDFNVVTVVGVSIAAVLVAIVIFGVLSYSYIQRQRKNGKGAGVLFSSTNPEYWNCSEVYVPDEWEVSRDSITLIHELGNGSFGMVWEGEAVGILPGVQCCRVAVKTVSDTSSIRDKVEFLKEASIMKAFNCNHVLRLLGVVSAGDPVLVVMELMENGDLKSFLRKRRPDAEDCSLPPPTDIELYQMAAEIADGMAYLADRKFVHRDLAARNCMVSGNFTCKIGDFGMARDVYETDYYRKGGKGFLPVRWMAPESLKDGVFCTASDIWSYGVVLWEMATLAEQPYQGKSNEEVMKYVLDGNTMDIPESCPQHLLELMLLCWQYKPRIRPLFTSIVQRLEGYLSIEFTERSFYHNGRRRKDTDANSCLSFSTENDNLSELPDVLADPVRDSPDARESFV